MNANILLKKSLVIAIIALFIGANVVSGYNKQLENSISNDNYNKSFHADKDKPYLNKVKIEDDILYLDECSDSLRISTPQLKIEEISGGLGLNIVIKNNGNAPISNIELNIDSIGGLINVIPVKQYEIPLLLPNESAKVHIDIFGFGLGIIKGYSKIKIKISSPDINTLEGIATVKILGPIVNIFTVVFNDEYIYDGYTLFSPKYSKKTYLINNLGEIVHEWNSKHTQGLGLYLLENGNLVRSCSADVIINWILGGGTGRVEMFNWNGTLIWEFDFISNDQCLHHDIEPLPNGNILMIVWDKINKSKAISAGCDPNDPSLLTFKELRTDYIIEVKPIGRNDYDIVWEWHVWDHLIQDFDPTKENYGVVANHPELLDINFEGRRMDITHINTIDYIEEFDQLLLTSRNLGEILIIDHSTTTEEAAGHTGGNYGKGGDFLYRWGNPQTYRAGDINNQKLFNPHYGQWIESDYPGEGHITVFNNGVYRPDGEYSSVEEIVPPVDSNGNYNYTPGTAYGPDEPIWTYTAENPKKLYSDIMSSAQRLPNGNTLICSSTQGLFLEVTSEKDIVWRYLNHFPFPIPRVNSVFKIQRYPLDYPGFGTFNNNKNSLNQNILRKISYQLSSYLNLISDKSFK